MDILSIAGTAMQRDMLGLNVISQNIANVTTPGYKKQIAPAFQAQLDNLMRAALPATVAAPTLDMAPGPMRPTGNANDMTIDGAGFFEIVTPTGPAYRKESQFRRPGISQYARRQCGGR